MVLPSSVSSRFANGLTLVWRGLRGHKAAYCACADVTLLFVFIETFKSLATLEMPCLG
jgi:hypothetical protein